ncbi:MAG: hypothetical protein HY962_06490 [Ignavibacteriae bacterium]|nr:hypothetical protein [Ignavibacteriota bacterium]
MGSSTMLDIIGALMIGGFFMLSVVSYSIRTSEASYYYNDDVIVQRLLSEVSAQLENDFRRIGYCSDPLKLPDPSKSIIAADSTRITFLTDLESDGTLDTVRYTLGSTSVLAGTPNPRDRMLSRRVNNNFASVVQIPCTQFQLRYFNALNAPIPFPITVPSEIYMIQLAVSVESSAAFDEDYPVAYWQQFRLASRNLRNR